MRLRGHHLICRLGFQGYGYDKKFAQTMKEVLTTLDLNPKLNIKVITTADILCAACPHHKNNTCSKENAGNQVKTKDKFVLTTLQLTNNKVYTLQEINRRICRYFTENNRQNLCQDCEWNRHDYCKRGLAAFKQAGE